MNCPECQTRMKVYATRNEGCCVIRYRICQNDQCLRVIKTSEAIDECFSEVQVREKQPIAKAVTG